MFYSIPSRSKGKGKWGVRTVGEVGGERERGKGKGKGETGVREGSLNLRGDDQQVQGRRGKV